MEIVSERGREGEEEGEEEGEKREGGEDEGD